MCLNWARLQGRMIDRKTSAAPPRMPQPSSHHRVTRVLSPSDYKLTDLISMSGMLACGKSGVTPIRFSRNLKYTACMFPRTSYDEW